MFGHHNVSANVESVPLADSFQNLQEDITTMRIKQRVAVMTAEGYEVETAGLLVALESPRHGCDRSSGPAEYFVICELFVWEFPGMGNG